MPRPKLQPVARDHAMVNHDNVAADARDMDADAPRRREIVETYGDGLPYERGRVVDRARFYLDQGARAMLETGKCLVQIKEFEQHGDFIDIVDSLGLTARTAQHMMSAAVKFLLPAGAKGREKLLALSPTKLYDLAMLDDDEVKELAKGKTVAGLTIDEVDAMSTRELRAHLREAQKTLEAKDKVLDQKNRKIDELTSATLAKPAWHQQLEKAIGSVDEVFSKLQLLCAETAHLEEAITDLEFEGVERETDLLALRAQVAVHFDGRLDLWLQQGVGLAVDARERLDALLSMAKKRLPQEVLDKLFAKGGAE